MVFQNPLISIRLMYLHMTENKTEEQMLAEEKERVKTESRLLQETLKSPFMNEVGSPAFNIEYAPHKTQGLQSASDMWIDKGRLFDGISPEKRDLEAIKKLSRQ